VVRLFAAQNWALGVLGRYKAEGFAEVEGEVEAGLLLALESHRWHLDLNALAGRGVEEEETDGELLLRGGFDASGMFRLGFEGRGRQRLAGDEALAGGRSWDVFGGPQVTASFDPLFASVLTGATTVGLASGVGWGSLLTIGGVM
jgi:hypothetical protein